MPRSKNEWNWETTERPGKRPGHFHTSNTENKVLLNTSVYYPTPCPLPVTSSGDIEIRPLGADGLVASAEKRSAPGEMATAFFTIYVSGFAFMMPPMHKTVATLVLLLCALPMLRAAGDAKPLRALMVCGGCCHDYEHQKHILADGISARANVEFTIVHEGKDRTNRVSIYEKPNWWQGYDVILHNECFGYVDDNKFIEGIAAAHAAGVPAVMLHCSEHSYRMGKTDEWRKLLGISSFSHEKARDLEVKVLKAEHPVMKDFPVTWHDAGDELYKNEKWWPNMIPLAQAYGLDTKTNHVCIWLNTYGDTRVFVTTLGHQNATMSDPAYLGLVTRGLLWACNKLDDKGEPKAGYAAVNK